MLDAKETLLIEIDIQGKLAEVMENPEALFENVRRLALSASELSIPLLVSEQFPDKLGPTREELSDALSHGTRLSKSAFSCCGDPDMVSAIKQSGKKQILLCGIEAHICILQTALELIENGFEVFIAADAISSRNPEHKRLALERMRQHGAEIVVTESVLFEWLRDAAHPAFREVRKFLG